MDRLAQMATFVKAVELGSFSAAADNLKLSSQLVGKQVKMLEQHLGVGLLNRATRKQSLTDFGRAFYQRAKIILADMEAAESMATVTRGVPSGRRTLMRRIECVLAPTKDVVIRESYAQEGRPDAVREMDNETKSRAFALVILKMLKSAAGLEQSNRAV